MNPGGHAVTLSVKGPWDVAVIVHSWCALAENGPQPKTDERADASKAGEVNVNGNQSDAALGSYEREQNRVLRSGRSVFQRLSTAASAQGQDDLRYFSGN